MKKYLTGAVALLILLGGCNTIAQPDDVTVTTAIAEQKSLSVAIDLASAFVPGDIVTVSSKLTGTVASVDVEVGQTVKTGDSLISLDAHELEAQLAQAKAGYDSAQGQAEIAGLNTKAAQSGLLLQSGMIEDQIATAKAALDSAKASLDAYTALNEKNRDQARKALESARRVLSERRDGDFTDEQVDAQRDAVQQAEIAVLKSEPENDTLLVNAQAAYDRAVLAYDQARGVNSDSQMLGAQSKYDVSQKQYAVASGSGIQQAQSAVQLLEAQLQNANIFAAINGVVLNKSIHPGELATTGAPLLTIADMSALKLRGTVAQTLVPYLTVGQKAKVTVDVYPGREFTGTITGVGPIAVSTGSYFPVEITVDNKTGELSAGETAKVVITVTGKSHITVPNSAVVQNRGQTCVFVIADGKPQRRAVVTGLRSADETEIISGLSQGETVAVTNANVLFDNMQITIKG